MPQVLHERFAQSQDGCERLLAEQGMIEIVEHRCTDVLEALEPPAPAPPKQVPPVDNKTPREYVQLAETAIRGADVDNAIALIDKARMRLLDQSAASNGFEPAIYKIIRELSTAKRLLSTEDYTGSLRSLDTALESLK